MIEVTAAGQVNTLMRRGSLFFGMLRGVMSESQPPLVEFDREKRLFYAARGGRVGARVGRRRSVLLRWRKEREGESRPPAQAKLRDGQRLPEPHRLHEQVIEAALAGELRRPDRRGPSAA
jgi:hypothetical protein